MNGDVRRFERPFEVDYDPESEEYCIFAPPGCVLVDGREVEIADADTRSNTVALDCLDPDDMPDALYAHVTQDESSTGGYKVEFDDEETKDGALFNFRVCRFGSSENDGNQYDICTSCVTLGGGIAGEALTNGCFALIVETEDPEGENEEPVRTAHFANRYYNYGNLTLTCSDRTLYEGDVIVALKITTTAYQQTPTASIEVYEDFPSLQADQHDLGYVVIPLYTLDVDFSILCDFRVLPIAPVGEVL